MCCHNYPGKPYRFFYTHLLCYIHVRNGLNASDFPEESNHIPSILCAPEIMLLGLTYNTNTIRLKPVHILRFPMTESAAAIDSIVDLLLAGTASENQHSLQSGTESS